MAKKAVVSKIPFLCLEVLGLCLSCYMYAVSAHLLGDGGLPCGRSKWFACESAVRGPFSHIGPLSVAAMGVIYYLLHLTLTSGLLDRVSQVLKFLLVLGGLVFVAWLRSLELVYLKKLCPWCWGVALITLIHAGLAWRLAVPPLPRLRAAALAGTIFGLFIVLVGLVTVVELGLGTGKLMQKQGFASDKEEKTVKPDRESKIVSADSTPKPVQPTPKKTPEPKPEVTPAGATPSPTPATTPKPAAKFDPEPELDDSPEVQILRARGWRHAGSGESVIKAIKVRPPVLMLAYDPFCEDCHALITKVLNNDEMNTLPVTRIAIQERMLSGQINDMIKEKPTLLLFGKDGDVLHKHVGSKITAKELADTIRQVIAKPTP